MTTEPTVACVMLARDRPEMSRLAVKSFEQQTYDPAKRVLLIFDSGDNASWFDRRSDGENIIHIAAREHQGKTIGALRNLANACTGADIICHFDSDDASAPTRIEDQVNRLLETGKFVTGYRSLMFYTVATDKWHRYDGAPQYALGTSLCYKRSYWEAHRFLDTVPEEDNPFVADAWNAGEIATEHGRDMMFARIHEGNHKPVVTACSNFTPLPDCRHLFPGAFEMAEAAR